MRVWQEKGPWQYEQVVAELARPGDRIVDVGTGGGEVLAGLIAVQGWRDIIAVDHNLSMAEVAKRRLASAAAVVVADGMVLPLGDRTVDLVLCRHALASPSEVARVLRPGGRLVCQQVGPRNAQSLFDAFGWGSNWDQFQSDPIPPRTFGDLASAFVAAGMTIERQDEYEGPYAFADLDSLVFFLKAAPFPEDFDPDRHLEGVNRLLAQSHGGRGIMTTEHRELLVAVK